MIDNIDSNFTILNKEKQRKERVGERERGSEGGSKGERDREGEIYIGREQEKER